MSRMDVVHDEARRLVAYIDRDGGPEALVTVHRYGQMGQTLASVWVPNKGAAAAAREVMAKLEVK